MNFKAPEALQKSITLCDEQFPLVTLNSVLAGEYVAAALVEAINSHRMSNPAAADNEFVLAVLKTFAWELSGISSGFCTGADGEIRRIDDRS